MNKTKKLLFAALALAALSGCANTRVAGLDNAPAAELAAPAATAAAAQPSVSRPMPSYGTFGGYRYRRFTTAAAAVPG